MQGFNSIQKDGTHYYNCIEMSIYYHVTKYTSVFSKEQREKWISSGIQPRKWI